MKILNGIIVVSLLSVSLNGGCVTPKATAPQDQSFSDREWSAQKDKSISKSEQVLFGDSNSPDKFLELKYLYEKSKPASFYDIAGVYSGRCYSKYTITNAVGYDIDFDRRNPIGAGLIVIERKSGVDHGPLFPEKVKEVSMGVMREETYFDLMDKNEIIKLLLESDKKLEKTINAVVKIVSLSPLIREGNYDSDTASPKEQKDIWSFATYQNYVLLKTTTGTDGVLRWKQGNQDREVAVRVGEDVRYCYFFNKKK